jgi:3-oxo-5alpha-steroid 4-dehydrogenase
MNGKIENSLSFARAYTNIEDALVVDNATDVPWKESADYVVIGYGGAGVAAANQAIDSGMSVIAVDRFEGGGATTLNGGVIYVGGGTSIQKAAGFNDSPEAMFEYLSREVGGIVSDETLRRFCESGPEIIQWLEAHGVRFNSTAYTKKTSYPASQYFLYFPDNALLERYRGKHPPQPRGHKVHLDLGKTASQGFGRGIVEPQQRAAAAAGVRLLSQCEARQLVIDRKGTVLGIKCNWVPPDHPKHNALVKAERAMQKWQLMLPSIIPGSQITLAIGKHYARVAKAIEHAAAQPLYIRSLRGLCLSSGGFIFNPAMMQAFAPPRYKGIMPLGTPADDGSGIMLGYSVGAALNRMDEISSWRFLNPPGSWAKGMMVNAKGERFVDEASYGATVGQAIMRPGNDGVGWLILDHELWQSTKHILKHDDLPPFQRDPARLAMWFGSKKAATLEELAAKIKVDPGALVATADSYRKAKTGEIPDRFQKAPSDMGAMAQAPYYAVKLGITSLVPMPSITLGGLLVDERSGLVLRDDGTTIPGLYAAGRTAVGLCSNLYLSGLSSSDCIFSGRRAAAHAATLNDGPGEPHVGFSAAAASRNFVPPR